MRLPIIATLVALTPMAAAAEVRLTGIEVLDAGTYETVAGDVTAEPGTPGGEILSALTATLIEATTSPKAVVGTDFGFRYKVVGEPEGAIVSLDYVVIYPEAGLPDPEIDTPIREARFKREKAIGATDYLGHVIEEPWEAVPGTWTFEIWQGGEQKAARSFTLTE